MTSEEFLAELDALDVGVVKERIASGVYLRPFRDLAQGWVEHKEAIASAKQMALARQAVKMRNGRTGLRFGRSLLRRSRWL